MTDEPIKRRKKTIIRREQLPPAKLATTRKPPPPKPKKKPKPAVKKVGPSPSDIRLDNLNASLNAFDTWRNYQPLAIGIDKQVFQHVAKHSLSCSKRVVRKLLHQHTRNTRYLQAIRAGECRFNLDGTEAGTINQIEQDHAGRMLAK